MIRPLRFAYADPPYLGNCGLYGHHRRDDGRCWDDPETHRALIGALVTEFPHGWALSLSVPSLRTVLPMTPVDARVGAWVKTFSIFKKGVRPAYAWEPVVFWRGRNPSAGFPHAPPLKRGEQTTPKDFVLIPDSLVLAEPITLRRGLTGAKPEAFCRWVLSLLNVRPGDVVVDIYPGTGVMGRVSAELTELVYEVREIAADG
jgi:hypothetical protein